MIFLCQFNIRLWNVQLEHFLCGKIYSAYSSLFYFTETNTNNTTENQIDEILDDWKEIHKNTQHGLALCYNMSKLNIIEVIEISSVLEYCQLHWKYKRELFYW